MKNLGHFLFLRNHKQYLKKHLPLISKGTAGVLLFMFWYRTKHYEENFRQQLKDVRLKTNIAFDDFPWMVLFLSCFKMFSNNEKKQWHIFTSKQHIKRGCLQIHTKRCNCVLCFVVVFRCEKKYF